MADARGNLALVFLGLVDRIRPRWMVFENVPGLLSSDGGRDFGVFLGTLGKCGYGFAYRILDAQYFGVPQRRHRVFVVGYLGDWQRAAAVLFERESLSGNPPPSREAWSRVAYAIAAGAGGGKFGSGRDAQDTFVIGSVGTLACNTGPNGHDAGNFQSNQAVDAGYVIPILEAGARTGKSTTDRRAGMGIGETGDSMFTLQSGHQHAIAFAQNTRDEVRLIGSDGNITGSLAAEPGMKQQTYIAFSSKNDAGDAGKTAPTLRAMNHDASHANAGGQVAVAFQTRIGRNGRGLLDTLPPQGYNDVDASPQEKDAIQAMYLLRKTVGEEAFAQWRLGVLDSFRAKKILRQDVHGGGIRCKTHEGHSGVDDGALSCTENVAAGVMREMWQAGRERRSPSGWGLSAQHARELDTALSELPLEGTPPGWLMQGLWEEGQGVGVLQSPLPTVQRGAFGVRRLTPREAERLQGFPDNYTAIPYRGKPATDGPRYRALGNSMCVPVLRWIGQRIQTVEANP